MKTAGRENQTRYATTCSVPISRNGSRKQSCSTVRAGRQEKLRPQVKCFFLTPFIELIRSYIYPNIVRTPGAVDSDITQDNIDQTICNPDWSTRSIRLLKPFARSCGSCQPRQKFLRSPSERKVCPRCCLPHGTLSAPSRSVWRALWPAADFHCSAQTSVANKTREQPMGKRTSFKPRETTSATVKSVKFDQ